MISRLCLFLGDGSPAAASWEPICPNTFGLTSEVPGPCVCFRFLSPAAWLGSASGMPVEIQGCEYGKYKDWCSQAGLSEKLRSRLL